ncbi:MULTISPECIES: hypothetical protein [unclassified Bradyrhizobium]|uniref:hypothetical protein n=1 Tax=unclassified Bradyrhizobium TaxID=2631580 RepID=UPI001FF9B367|nr:MULTISPECIES: hypothetical protein [unclassified Bradyrhizobium]
MTTSDVKHMIALLDTERIDHAQILAPSFASHDEGDEPAQQTARISGLIGNERGTTHLQIPAIQQIRPGGCLNSAELARRK